LDPLAGLDNALDFHQARRGEITMGNNGEESVERALGDDEAFPDVFGAELDGRTPEALRAATPLGTGDGMAADFLADTDMHAFTADDGFEQDGGFEQGGFDAFDDEAAPVTPIDAAALLPADSRRATLLSTALGANGLSLLELQAADFTPGALPGSAAAAAALVTPAPGFEPLDDTPAATLQAKKRRKYVARDASTELSSPAIRAQLDDTSPTLIAPRTAPASDSEWAAAAYNAVPLADRLYHAPVANLGAPLAGLFRRVIASAIACRRDASDDAASSAHLATDALGAELADAPDAAAFANDEEG
jgi:hypothetical protein